MKKNKKKNKKTKIMTSEVGFKAVDCAKKDKKEKFISKYKEVRECNESCLKAKEKLYFIHKKMLETLHNGMENHSREPLEELRNAFKVMKEYKKIEDDYITKNRLLEKKIKDFVNSEEFGKANTKSTHNKKGTKKYDKENE